MDSTRIARSDAKISSAFDAGLSLLQTITRLQQEVQSFSNSPEHREVLAAELSKSTAQYKQLRDKLTEMHVISDFDREIEMAVQAGGPNPIRHTAVAANVLTAHTQLYGTSAGTTPPPYIPPPVMMQRPPAVAAPAGGGHAPQQPPQPAARPTYGNPPAQQYNNGGAAFGHWSPPHTAAFNGNPHYNRPHWMDSANYDNYLNGQPSSLRAIETPAGWQRDVIEAGHRFLAAGMFAAVSHFATKVFGGSHAPWG